MFAADRGHFIPVHIESGQAGQSLLPAGNCGAALTARPGQRGAPEIT
jgi:hypothetical protein